MRRFLRTSLAALAASGLLAASSAAIATGPEPTPPAKSKASKSKDSKEATYTCPMHPKVEQKGPGQCPECAMDLVPKK